MTSISKITEELKQKIRKVVKEVLVKEHTDPNKRMIKEMPGRLNLACPYCGDSHTDTHKKRGNLYWSTLQYHCFNCGIHTDLYGIVKDHHVKFSDTSDSLQVIEYIKEHKVEVNDVETLQHGIFKLTIDMAPTRQELKQKLGLVEIEPGDSAWFYLKNRLLSNKLEYFLFNPKDKRLHILNVAPGDKVISFQTRALVKTNSSRYLTYDMEKLYELMEKPFNLTEEEKVGVKKLSTLFNIMMINFSDEVTVFEGPIDAIMLHNSIALASVTRSTDELDEIPSIRYMFDNDEAGKKKMIEKLKRGKKVFMWDKFLTETNMDKYPKKIKDLNDLVIAAWESKSDCLTKMKDYFSNSRLDAYYL